MSDINFEIIEDIAVLSESPKGWRKELNLVSWNGEEAKLDLRNWSPGHEKMGKGVTLTDEEAVNLKEALSHVYDKIKSDSSLDQPEIDGIQKSLTRNIERSHEDSFDLQEQTTKTTQKSEDISFRPMSFEEMLDKVNEAYQSAEVKGPEQSQDYEIKQLKVLWGSGIQTVNEKGEWFLSKISHLNEKQQVLLLGCEDPKAIPQKKILARYLKLAQKYPEVLKELNKDKEKPDKKNTAKDTKNGKPLSFEEMIDKANEASQSAETAETGQCQDIETEEDELEK